MDLKVGAGLNIDRSRVPADLQDLIPLVARWGFERQADQDDFVAAMEEAFPQEVEEFNRGIDSDREKIRAWRRTLTEFDQHKDQRTPEGWVHPYWSFLAALKVRELTEPANSPEMLAATQRLSADAHKFRFGNCILRAAELFREKDYRGFVELLEPYIDLLDASQKKKLEFAKSRIA